MKAYKQIKELELLAENSQVKGNIPPVSQLVQFWPFIRIALTLTKVFTGPKADARINEIIKWGDLLALVGKASGK